MNIKKIIKSNKFLYNTIKKLYTPIRTHKLKKVCSIEYERTIDMINKVNKNSNKVFFIGIPIHNNLGDQAQYYCIKKWLLEYYPKHDVIEIADYLLVLNYKKIIETISSICKDADMFVFQSGYRTTDVENIYGEYAHRVVLKTFKNKVLVFPQTINFKNSKESNNSSSSYSSNGNYLFLARDNVSFDMAKKIYDDKRVLLFPDIVTSLIGEYTFNNKRDGILFCIRNDNEKLYSDNKINELIKKLSDRYGKIDVTDTNIDLDINEIRNNIKNVLEEKFNQFSNYKMIITDRYHGTIFSLISNTPVIVLNSTDHKLSSGVDWFKGVYDEYVFYARTLEDVENYVNIISKNEYKYKLVPYFNDKYYSKLKKTFDSIEGKKL